MDLASSSSSSHRDGREKSSKDGTTKSTKSDERKEKDKGRNGSSRGGRGGPDSVTSKGNVKLDLVEVVDRVSRTGSLPTHKALVKTESNKVADEAVDRVSRTGSENTLKSVRRLVFALSFVLSRTVVVCGIVELVVHLVLVVL
jgi:hypothetical protein